MELKALRLRQLAEKMEAIDDLRTVTPPASGWVKAIRIAIGMSARQLGAKLGMSAQGIHDLERREKDGLITLNTLRNAANALNMQLVYALMPKDGNLESYLYDKARSMATNIVQRTSQSMKLEDQENSKKRIEQAIDELTESILKELPKSLWD